MNTKILLLAIFFILSVPAKLSIGSYNQPGVKQTNALENTLIVMQAESSLAYTNEPTPWGITFPNNYSQGHHTSHNADDDGKSHHFHFNRFQKRRSRNLLCLIAKIILLITHALSFLACVNHIIH